ncbi:hypothetical protein B0O99DRAFT_589087 [Bisporella sp. PMI_857]|nr:hypothetical protein B0O99DRAFT_589087 [Bisporella sp. PMI_857]
MFDVAWTDPASETVGQRRRRKEREGGASDRRGSIKTTSSSASSQTNSTSRTNKQSSGWGLFGGKKSSSKPKLENNGARPKTPSDFMSGAMSSLSISTKESDNSKEDLAMSRKLELERERKEREREEREERDRLEREYHESVQSPPTPVESVFSLPTHRSTKTESTFGGSVSDMAPSKYYYGRSPPSSHPAPYEHDIYAPSERSTFYDDPNASRRDDDSIYAINPSHQFPRAPSSASKSHPSSSRRPARQISKPPPPINRPLPEPPRPENSAIRLRVRRMEAASSKIILQRLVEEWDDDEDEAIYNELEFEKQLWMLVGLRYLRKRADSRSQGRLNGPLEPCKVLSLYENHACANTLSTMYPIGSKTHHLSSNPPSTIEQTSHLHTLIVTTPTTSLPYAASTFSAITSLRLPMLLPASSIPNILQECNRILTPTGTLQLTIVDPLPDTKSMGPKMRAWLEDHLLLKLETLFRCLKPAKLMPIWLEDAGFVTSAPAQPHGTVRITESSTQATPIRTGFAFRAIGKGEGGYRGSSKDKDETDMLASTVGRMLWKEIYGPFVVGKSWWWEDEEIVDECYTMGTKWEVMIIEAAKKA